MNKIDIAKLVEGRKGRVLLPPLEERIGSVVEYRRTLLNMLQGLASETRRSVLPELARERKLTTDAPNGSWFRHLYNARTRFMNEAEARMRRNLSREAERHTDTFRQIATRALGIDLAGIIQKEDIGDYVQAALQRNVSLIKSLADDAVNRVEQAVFNASVQGRSSRQLRVDLQEQFGMTQKRANLIARDQLAKINSDLTRIRQEQVGIKKYVWSTSQDERVRPRHQELDGKEYKWGEPTGAEGGASPGQPIQCRCLALAVIEF